MLTLHSFLQSVVLFVKALAVKVKKEQYRTSSVVMAGAVVIAIVTFGANGFGGSGRNAMAAPRIQESAEEPEEPEEENKEETDDHTPATAKSRKKGRDGTIRTGTGSYQEPVMPEDDTYETIASVKTDSSGVFKFKDLDVYKIGRASCRERV